jgi:hypothetical protein
MAAIVPSEIKYYLTPAGNSDPELSLGGVGGDVEIGVGLNDIFDYVNVDESIAGDVEYRAIDVKNINAVETLWDAVIYISQITSGPDDSIKIAYDATGTQDVADESTAPSSPALSFSAPLSRATGIALGDIAPDTSVRIWIERTVTAGASSVISDGELNVTGGTFDSGA